MNSKTEKICTVLVILYIVVYSIILVNINKTYVYNHGEWDDYSLPVVSMVYEKNIGISAGDIAKYKEHFYEFGKYIDGYSLSGFQTKNGEEMTWYFPTYSFVAIPMFLLCVSKGISAEYAFVYTNIILLIAALLVVFACLKVEKSKKVLLIGILSLNPILFYIGWVSAEVFIYSFMIMGLVFWYNKQYKRAAFFISVAGMMNPTIMSIGIIMIVEFFYEIVKDKSQNEKFSVWIRIYNKKPEIMRFGMCFIIGVIPIIYNLYNTGHINLTAAYSVFTEGNESTFQRFTAYLFDLNFGMLVYYLPLMLIATILFLLSVVRRKWRYIVWLFTFLINVYLYSIMVHINSGMSGIARYNAWGAVILIFAVVCFFDGIEKKKQVVIATWASLSVGVLITTSIVWFYGPHYAEKIGQICFTPIAEFVMDKCPALYNPLPSTFNSRLNHIDGGYTIENPLIYENVNGEVRKIYASAADKQYILDNYEEENSANQEWFEEKLDELGEEKQYLSIGRKYRVKKRLKEYILGSEISFMLPGYNVDKYTINGVYAPEEAYSWTKGKQMKVGVYIPEGKGENLVFEMDIDGVFNSKQQINVVVNGKEVYSKILYEGDCKVEFEFACPENGKVEMDFELPDAVSPKALNVSEDQREIAISLKKMRIDLKK